MTIAQLETWLNQARDLGAGDNALILAILPDGRVKDIDHAEPYNGATGTPVLVLAK